MDEQNNANLPARDKLQTNVCSFCHSPKASLRNLGKCQYATLTCGVLNCTFHDKFEITINKLYDTFEAEKDIIAVYLFGSVARGDFSIRHSDLDLFVILDQRKPLSKTVKQMENTIKGIAFQEGVRAHLEFQGLEVNDEDRSLLRKVMEEGRLIFSRGFVAFDKYKIGLKPFLLYHFSVINKENRARFSQILHGYTSFYYKDTTTGKKLSKEKILKEYKGIIDGRDIIEAGKGALLVAKEKEKYITKLFVDFSVEYKQIRMIYLE